MYVYICVYTYVHIYVYLYVQMYECPGLYTCVLHLQFTHTDNFLVYIYIGLYLIYKFWSGHEKMFNNWYVRRTHSDIQTRWKVCVCVDLQGSVIWCGHGKMLSNLYVRICVKYRKLKASTEHHEPNASFKCHELHECKVICVRQNVF